jgi:DNA repair exonuclease SbcCD ATPase subunit
MSSVFELTQTQTRRRFLGELGTLHFSFDSSFTDNTTRVIRRWHQEASSAFARSSDQTLVERLIQRLQQETLGIEEENFLGNNGITYGKMQLLTQDIPQELIVTPHKVANAAAFLLRGYNALPYSNELSQKYRDLEAAGNLPEIPTQEERNIQARVARLMNRVQPTPAQNNDVQQRIQTIMAAQRAQVDQLLAQHAQDTARLDQEARDWQSRTVELTRRNDALDAAQNRLAGQIAERERDVAHLEQEIDKTSDAIREANKGGGFNEVIGLVATIAISCALRIPPVTF